MPLPMSRRAFTVEEANALLPRMREVLHDIRGLRGEVEERSEKLQVLDALWGTKVQEPDNPDHAEFLDLRHEVRERIDEIEALIEEEILNRGIRFPAGGLEHGLLDFPTTYEGRWVYLCWHLGEPEVRQWHEVDAGFRGRRSLTPEQTDLMGKVDDPADVDDSVLDF